MFLIGLLVGLVMLVGGAELLVRGGGQVALALRVPALIVGLTIVAFGTSTPELAVSVTAAFAASTEMALANVTGSNIANIALVLGIAAMVAPLRVDRALIRREIPVCVGLQLMVPLVCINGVIGRGEGIVLLVAGLAYNGLLVRESLRRRRLGIVDNEEDALDDTGDSLPRSVAYLLLGMVVLVLGAHLFVTAAVEVAHVLGMSDRFIGLTVLAMGTSAPEVATAVVSSWRGKAALAIGNSLGSNILNVAMVLGITSIIRPIEMLDPSAWLDLAVAVGVTLLLIPFVLRDSRITRVEGMVMAGGYVSYLLFSPG